MRYWQVVGSPHYDERHKKFIAGDVVEDDGDLGAKFPNKFREVKPQSEEAIQRIASRKAGDKDPAKSGKDPAVTYGKEVTDQFPTNNKGYQVYLSDAKEYTVTLKSGKVVLETKSEDEVAAKLAKKKVKKKDKAGHSR